MNPNDALSETTDDARRRMVVDMLLDGEPVDKIGLREALDDADTRDYLIDALLLRQLAIDMAPNTFPVVSTPGSPAARFLRWTAAAAVVIATAVAGYTLGREGAATTQVPESRAGDAALSEPAPQPTHTIRFDPGKTWITNLEGR
jgi:hypothetical protein